MEENKNIPIVPVLLIDYDNDHYEEKKITDIDDMFPYLESSSVTWVDVDGTHCSYTNSFLAKKLGLHPLLIEDINLPDQRPKIDEYENHLYVLVKMLDYDDEEKKITIEQVSFVLGENYLISFQETGKTGDVFGSVRERIKNSRGKHRKYGADYLLYSLLDVIIDHYFVILEKIGEDIEELEDEVINKPDNKKLTEIYNLKRELINVRKSVWPLREVLSRLDKESENNLVKEPTHIYIRDLYQHSIQVIDSVESFRDILSSLVDIYLSSISNRMNSVMKVLTIISTIFMPLTFIVGLYGMNFKYMPELEWKYGYYLVWAICLFSVTVMLIFFRKKKWL